MERKEAIQNACWLAGANNFCDGMIACSMVDGKAICRAVWGMGKAECDEYLPNADITCLDHSPDMMGQAQKRTKHLGLKNAHFQYRLVSAGHPAVCGGGRAECFPCSVDSVKMIRAS